MNRNKGFTLIELLAVIVILAIIALIATPIVLGIINDAKESSNKQSASFIINAVEQSYSMAYALGGGQLPKIDEVRERFTMDNATWEGTVIKTNDDAVICNVVTDDNEFAVDCGEDMGVKSISMEISTGEVNS